MDFFIDVVRDINERLFNEWTCDAHNDIDESITSRCCHALMRWRVKRGDFLCHKWWNLDYSKATTTSTTAMSTGGDLPFVFIFKP